jgi:membrane protein YqaA with SNARE-associated domain
MELTILSTALGLCIAGAVFPWISAEVVLVGAVAALPPGWGAMAVVTCAAGQVAGKVGIYGLVRGAPERLPERAASLLSRAEGLASRPRLLAAAVLSGSAVALPPLYLITLASGLARLPLALFVGAAMTGSLLRYGALVWGVGMLGMGGAG